MQVQTPLPAPLPQAEGGEVEGGGGGGVLGARGIPMTTHGCVVIRLFPNVCMRMHRVSPFVTRTSTNPRSAPSLSRVWDVLCQLPSLGYFRNYRWHPWNY